MGKYRNALILIGIINIFYTCDDPSQVGVDFIGEDPLTVTYYDTLSVSISTVRIDSLPTSNLSGLLIGKSEDEHLGSVTAKAFFQVGRDSLGTYPDDENAKYDSLTLEMIFNGYSYYDTTQIQTFYLYSVIDEMELGDDGLLYNTSDVPYDTTSVYYLGQVSFLPRVRKDEPEYMRLDDVFGRTLFELLQQKDDIVTSSDEFKAYIRGFALVPDTSNTCIIGLGNETNIKLFYRQDGAQVEQVFPIANNIHFTRIAADTSNAVFHALPTQRASLSSDETGDIAFIQGGTGLGIRLEFPYLDYVRELSENNLVTDAELILRPVKGSYSGLNPLPSDLTAYKIDKYNNITGEFVINPLLFYDDEYNEDTFYRISINGFLEDQLNLLENDGSALLITLPKSDDSGTVNRIYIGNKDHRSKSYLRLLVMNINDAF
ncbi:MAG: DUF4270 family protein [Cytophagales bacterium]|nr:DUF4270 family protein [Cytophagales bacterium]